MFKIREGIENQPLAASSSHKTPETQIWLLAAQQCLTSFADFVAMGLLFATFVFSEPGLRFPDSGSILLIAATACAGTIFSLVSLVPVGLSRHDLILAMMTRALVPALASVLIPLAGQSIPAGQATIVLIFAMFLVQTTSTSSVAIALAGRTRRQTAACFVQLATIVAQWAAVLFVPWALVSITVPNALLFCATLNVIALIPMLLSKAWALNVVPNKQLSLRGNTSQANVFLDRANNLPAGQLKLNAAPSDRDSRESVLSIDGINAAAGHGNDLGSCDHSVEDRSGFPEIEGEHIRPASFRQSAGEGLRTIAALALRLCATVTGLLPISFVSFIAVQDLQASSSYLSGWLGWLVSGYLAAVVASRWVFKRISPAAMILGATTLSAITAVLSESYTSILTARLVLPLLGFCSCLALAAADCLSIRRSNMDKSSRIAMFNRGLSVTLVLMPVLYGQSLISVVSGTFILKLFLAFTIVSGVATLLACLVAFLLQRENKEPFVGNHSNTSTKSFSS